MSVAGLLFKDKTTNTTLLLEVILSSCVEDGQILFGLCELFTTYTQTASRLYENFLIAVSKKAVFYSQLIIVTEMDNVLWYDRRQPKVE